MSEFITKVVVAADNQTAPALNAATKGIQNYAKAATAAQSQVRGASRQSRAALQQLGYQVQDISVQLQAGQSPFIVLAQQGSQVASIFGPGGAVIGALIAVGGAIAGNLLPSLFSTTDKLEELNDQASKLGKTLLEIAPIAAAEKATRLKNEIASTTTEIEKQKAIIAAAMKTREMYEKSNIGLATTRKLLAQDETNAIKAAGIEIETQLARQLELQKELATVSNVMTDDEVLAFSRAMLARNQKEQAKLQEEVNAAIASAATPQQKYNELFAKYNEWLNKNIIDEFEYLDLTMAAEEQLQRSIKTKKADNKVTKDRTKSYEELVAQFRPALALGLQYQNFVKEISGYGLTEAEVTELKSLAYADLVKKLEELGKVQKKVAKEAKVVTGDGYQATALEEYANAAKDLDKALEDAAMGGIRSIEDGFVNMINGSQSVADSFRSMAASIVNDLIRIQIQRSITGPLAGMMGNFFGNPTAPMMATTAPTATGSYIPMDFAGGGYTGSGVRSGGLDGKGGFMAMVHPNETVIDHEKGTGGGGVTVVQNINVSTGVQQTVRAEIQNLLPQITQATKQAVADSRQRGGGFSKALVGA